MLRRDELLAYLDELLDVRRYDDYAPNGLQVEGAEVVRTVVSGVTASRALVEAAVRAGADARAAVCIRWRTHDTACGLVYRRGAEVYRCGCRARVGCLYHRRGVRTHRACRA